MQRESNEILGKERSTSIPEVKSTTDPSIAITAPGQIKVIKRNGTVVSFEESKITVAITKAFLAVEGGNAAASSRVHKTVEKMTDQVIATFHRRMPSGGTIHIEDIQDQVELALMRAEEHKTARNYVIYREERARRRAAKQNFSPEAQKAAGSLKPLIPFFQKYIHTRILFTSTNHTQELYNQIVGCRSVGCFHRSFMGHVCTCGLYRVIDSCRNQKYW